MLSPIDQYLASKQEANMDFSVLRLHRFREALGLEKQFPPMILVGGTNGKGSTVAFLGNILQAHDLRVGTFTSPHLHHVQERILLDQKPIDVQAWNDSGDFVLEAMRRTAIDLTYFETITFLAYHYFCQTQPDICIFEVGLGGRMDATNCLPHQRSIITSIDLDHTEYLGTTLQQIAREKAHIMVPHGFNILASVHKDAASWLLDHGGATIQKVCEGVDFQHSGNSQSFSYASKTGSISQTRLGLEGPAQSINAALAITCSMDVLGEAWNADKTKQALIQTRHAGRMERWVLDEKTFYLDAAHNPASMEHLVGYIRTHRPIKRYRTYMGCSENKDVQGMMEHLMPLAQPLLTVGFNHPRSWKTCQQMPLNYDQVQDALADALDQASMESIWTGSIFFMAEVRSYLQNRGGFQKDSFFP